jgi:hypothetical protein
MTNRDEVAPKKRIKTLLETPRKPKPIPAPIPGLARPSEVVIETLEQDETLVSLSHDRHGNAVALSSKNRLYMWSGKDTWERMR